jgi:hypothetical protein
MQINSATLLAERQSSADGRRPFRWSDLLGRMILPLFVKEQPRKLFCLDSNLRDSEHLPQNAFHR